MSGQANPAPRDTALLAEAIRRTRAGIPEVYRKAALKNGAPIKTGKE
jgi:hypothetical protein